MEGVLDSMDLQRLECVAVAVQPHLQTTCAPNVATIMAAIVLTSNESLGARAACRAVHINESSRDRVGKLASKVPHAIRKALEAFEHDPRDGV